MLRASALYIVIVIALVIAVICSSLIVVAYFYKIQDQKKNRYDNLSNNLDSGVNLLLAGQDTSYMNEKTFSLFGSDRDSVSLRKSAWGIFDVGVARAFIQKDTLFKCFFIAKTIDSTKWAAMYVIDEDKPLSLSGNTVIRGDAYIPKGQVNTAYIDNKFYTGDKRLIIGPKHDSERKLPELQKERLLGLANIMEQAQKQGVSELKSDSTQISFLSPTRYLNFGKKTDTLKNLFLKGNVVLFSDTSLVIDSSTVLNNIIIFAKSIVIKSGFHGNCQLFALDSIGIGRNCAFTYPSCLGILRYKQPKVNLQAKIHIGFESTFGGIMFTYEKTTDEPRPLIKLDKDVKVTGQIYSQGLLETMDNVKVNGSVYTSSYYYADSFTLYENYLIDISIDSKALSKYYLTSKLTPVAGSKNRILKWLEAN